MTPEGKVKKSVKDTLQPYLDKKLVDGFWPVPYGYGESHLDYVGCANGLFFCIEVKAPGKRPTPRQVLRIQNVAKAKGRAFVIDGTDKTHTVQELKTWLMLVTGV